MWRGLLTEEKAVDQLPAAEVDPQAVVALAERLLAAALKARRPAEKRAEAQLSRMMDDEAGKAFTFAMADEVFRPPTAKRQARLFHDLVERFGVPSYLPLPSRMALKLGTFGAKLAPALVMPKVTQRLRDESAEVILPDEEPGLSRHLRKRKEHDIGVIVNQLGEAVLGEEEALRRLRANLDRLADPACEAISVKLSAIFSQIHPVADLESVAVLKDRLREIYRSAMRHPKADGMPKYVNLDMEEYRDLRLTCATFVEVLSEEEFHHLEAGLVLQAYLPDAWPVQKALNAWGRQRVENGGAGIRIRLVKGANLAMERVDAEWHDWPLAPYGSKVESDANFKRMMQEACRPENAAAVAVGIASHNLFDLAYGLLLREKNGVAERVRFEMLEGMANHQARTVKAEAGGLVLYAPVVAADDFPSAIAYLIRRLDENTTPENFLHDLFGMQPGDEAWLRQVERFKAACDAIPTTPWGPARGQDRAAETHAPTLPDEPFDNEADTDFSLEANVDWIRARVAEEKEAPPAKVPLQIGGIPHDGKGTATTEDPSRPGTVVCEYAEAGWDEVMEAIETAVDARQRWMAKPAAERTEILLQAAAELSAVRGKAIATMVREAGKSVVEADVEVSEAIDFANYYARSLSADGWSDGSSFTPIGPVVVTPPWNFPFAIPCGGVLAPLAAGTSVILKPAPQTVLTAWVMAEALWRAGVPREVLQFVPCPDGPVGQELVTDSRIGAVILTGGFDTARLFLSWKPDMNLFAETSGKNSLIITAAADPDLAVKDLVRSAFGHAGQKCSAASLAILEAEVFNDPSFRRKLADAASSLRVGPSWDFASVVTPVIRPPGPELRRALSSLDGGESWLVEPRQDPENPQLWSPGIKLGVKPDSWFRRTECFGPVLGVVCARDLRHAIEIQNDSSFALTGGLHSLDPQEIARWREQAQVGNGYINRPITGAIVRRQPFGGWKQSCFGPGAKAGGPNYVAQFGAWEDAAPPEKKARVSPAVEAFLKLDATGEFRPAAESDAWWMKHEFGIEHDPSGLKCESNVFRYRAVGRVLLRSEDERDLRRMMIAALASGRTAGDIDLSLVPDQPVFDWMRGFTTLRETDKQLADRIAPGLYGSMRVVGAPPSVRSAAAENGLRLSPAAPVSNGRVELTRYFHEQAISQTLHRHGSPIPTISGK
ncbi:proline dehydrogenase family protein [Haloferula sargassicola]|uniref:L-glutamate gamma-semialdehyde dehydrogenase n=1 Tax=Haloferula sargassicola TaxID=490096 RepID=A0ABP9UPM5_9BACT